MLREENRYSIPKLPGMIFYSQMGDFMRDDIIDDA
jgi:hypothetical protein